MSAINQHPSSINRASEIRTNPSALAELWQSGRIMHICEGRIESDGNSIRYLNASDISAAVTAGECAEGSRYFLGFSAETNTPYWAWDTSWVAEKSDEEKADGFLTLRELVSQLNAEDSELALHAIGLSNWHRAHPRCPRCGGETHVDLGGAARVCTVDQSQHHPRTDSAVIVLIRDRADRILLGHQAVWPEGRFSTFAGFVEPGETFEQCVAREVFEESGLTVTELHYLGSQPWPFPASIMVAFEAITDLPEKARPDGEEITEVKWFSREELKTAAADQSLLLPPKISVARKMIERWLGAELSGGETWR